MINTLFKLDQNLNLLKMKDEVYKVYYLLKCKFMYINTYYNHNKLLTMYNKPLMAIFVMVTLKL